MGVLGHDQIEQHLQFFVAGKGGMYASSRFICRREKEICERFFPRS